MFKHTTITTAILLALSTCVLATDKVTGTAQILNDGNVVQTFHTYKVGQTSTATTPQQVIPEQFSAFNAQGIESLNWDRDTFIALEPGEVLTTRVFGSDIKFTSQNKVLHDNGDVSIVGTIDGYIAVITFGTNGSVIGTVNTTQTTYSIDNVNGSNWIIDHTTAGVQYPEHGNDGMQSAGATVTLPPVPVKNVPAIPTTKLSSTQLATIYGISSVTPKVVIDLFIMYTNTLTNPTTKINNDIAVTNAAYQASGLTNLSVRLVGTQMVTYTDASPNTSALNDMTAQAIPGFPGTTSSSNVFKGTLVTKNSLGADIQVLIRPFKYPQQVSCGNAWLNGGNGTKFDVKYTYAVVSDGSSGSWYCVPTTFAHELGHGMGASHDAAHAVGYVGHFPYSYGYGVNGMYGDIMSYYSPVITAFSSPYNLVSTVNKTNYYLGATDQADVVKTLQQTFPLVAALVPTKK